MQNLEQSHQLTVSAVIQPGPDIPTSTTLSKILPHTLPKVLAIFQGQDGKAYAAMYDTGNPYALPVGSRQLNNVIRQLFHDEARTLKRNDLAEINDHLKTYAEMYGKQGSVWYRVAPIKNGVEFDVGDPNNTRIIVNPSGVHTLQTGSETLFFRAISTRQMVLPSEAGDLGILKKYLNMHPVSIELFMGWLSYTLAHPKTPSSKYVILLLQGNQGTGKTSLCNNIILNLLDPNTVGVQMLPNNQKDLAIATQGAHVLCYDNLRSLSQLMADTLCVASTGGSIATRQLYTDASQEVLKLHAALVLNGIHSFVDQPDLAQRCLPINLLPLDETDRKSELEIIQSLHVDLPIIFRGLLDLIADIFTVLPTVEVTNPERMIDFVHWLAAMEKVQGVPAGVYQTAYSEELRQGQLDSLLDSLLASELLAFIQKLDVDGWSGTPSQLLIALNKSVQVGVQRSREWPQNPIALSKRLILLQAALISQGIRLEFSRGKHRTISIKTAGAINHG